MCRIAYEAVIGRVGRATPIDQAIDVREGTGSLDPIFLPSPRTSQKIHRVGCIDKHRQIRGSRDAYMTIALDEQTARMMQSGMRPDLFSDTVRARRNRVQIGQRNRGGYIGDVVKRGLVIECIEHIKVETARSNANTRGCCVPSIDRSEVAAATRCLLSASPARTSNGHQVTPRSSLTRISPSALTGIRRFESQPY